MNTRIQRNEHPTNQQRHACLKWLSLTLALQVPASAVDLTVSPASVSNTFTGTITLTISGLTNSELVRLQKLQDDNANGTIDAGERMVSAFGLRDGVVNSIGGVRNRNLPGDEDLTANREIRVRLRLSMMSELERAIGTYVYRVLHSTDLSNWNLVGDHYPGPTFQFTDTVPPGARHRFHRVELSQ